MMIFADDLNKLCERMMENDVFRSLVLSKGKHDIAK
jgi:hypothetical protein